MKTLLTGITGNLGYEMSLDLTQRGITVIPCVRPGKNTALSSHPVKFEEVVECNLTDEDIKFSGHVDNIIHSAGVVHFRDAVDKNEQMMRRVIKLAESLHVPIHYVSTAYVYRPPGSSTDFNNNYEKDKFNAEQLLIASGVPHTVFRPSILVGHSRTGEIRNFSGYYLIVRAFVSAIRASEAKNHTLRFPRMTGLLNMVPVDHAAESIGRAIQENRLETLYVTNPRPPRSDWVLDEIFDFYSVSDRVKIMDTPFQEFGKTDLTEEEIALYHFASHFSPYWSMEYSFPDSIYTENAIDHDYLVRILKFFRDSEVHG